MATFPKKIWQYCLLTVMSLFFMSTQCDWGDEYEWSHSNCISEQLTALQVSVLDNSRESPKELVDNRCRGRALVLKAVPIWESRDSVWKSNRLQCPIRKLDIYRLDADGMNPTNITENFLPYITPYNKRDVLWFGEYDDDISSGVQEIRYTDPYSYFLMACVKDTDSLKGYMRFKIIVTFSDGSTLSGESCSVNVY